MQNLKIKYLGRGPLVNRDKDTDLLINIISSVSKYNLVAANSLNDADLVIVYPYVINNFSYKLKWLACQILRRLSKRWRHHNHLRWLLGVSDKKVIFVSHENLDRPYWWNAIGQYVIESDISRLTFWPKAVDPGGCRFPYWYNYVSWPQYPRPNFYKRFGQLYELKYLMAPLPLPEGRNSKAISIASHLDFPRKFLLEATQKVVDVDMYGVSGIKFEGSKIKIMRQYQYAFCPENSVGYGYDTEKLPEAWIAGCLPLGAYLNPYSDFNPIVINQMAGDDSAYKFPLLNAAPSLVDIEDYVKKLF